MYVVCYCRTRFFPRGAARAKRIFDHPLAIVFVRHWCAVVHAQRTDQVQFCLARCRHNAIDHRIWKACVLVDPIRQICVAHPCQTDNCLAQNCPVALQVIATLSGEWTNARSPPRFERCNHRPKGSAWRVGFRRVVHDIRMISVQRPGRIAVVTTFRDCQGNNPNSWGGHDFNQSRVVLFDR